jgi:hypothetical protein
LTIEQIKKLTNYYREEQKEQGFPNCWFISYISSELEMTIEKNLLIEQLILMKSELLEKDLLIEQLVKSEAHEIYYIRYKFL